MTSPTSRSRANRGAGGRTPARLLFALLLQTVVLAGCATSPYVDPEDVQLPVALDRSQVLEKDGVRVTVDVPTEQSVSRLFGVRFAEYGVQPIWIGIENHSDTDYWLLPVAIDRDYYSADEAAFVIGADLSEEERDDLRELLRANALPFFHKAGRTQRGYVYATHMTGGRFIDVQLSSAGAAVRLRFAVLLPTEGFDYERSELRRRYAAVGELPDLSVEELRQALRSLPCCVSSEDGTGEGDPLNVAIVGTGKDVLAALVAAGWDFTERITADTVRRMIGAAIAEKSFLTAPVSSLYLFGRKQDVALQRGRSTINQRNHMRLWLAPFRCEGKPVWVGQVSRDIGVKFTTESASLTTHVIDPVVDESREYLFHSLLHQHAVGRFAFVRGFGPATPDKPRHNLTGDPFYTDGMRLVLWISSDPVPPELAVDLAWNPSADPVLEGRSEYSIIPSLRDAEAGGEEPPRPDEPR